MTSSVHGPLEDETCRRFVLPALTERAGWPEDRIRWVYPITRGRIHSGTLDHWQDRPEIADYVLEHSGGVPVAVIQARRSSQDPAEGVERARRHAELLDVPFAYSTNGVRVIELDRRAGRTAEIAEFPAPRELWTRYKECRDLSGEAQDRIASAPLSLSLRNWDDTLKQPRYYQEVAINTAVQAIARGGRRVFLVLAAGSGKTLVATQVAAKLCHSRWPEGRKPRILYLSDRAILLDQARDGYFRPVFGEAVHAIGQGDPGSGHHIYLGLCPPAGGTSGPDDIYRQFSPGFFDLVIVDDCHGGSRAEDAPWHPVLERFSSAVHIGLTATPLTRKDAGVYRHFGDSLYEYSLARGIADGFLAPYQVRKVRLDPDGEPLRPREAGMVSPDGMENLYMSWERTRLLATLDRTEEAARYLTDFMHRSGRLNKTLVFCQDSRHAARVTEALSSANADLVREHGPGYACQITSADHDRELLDRFRRAESEVPAIAVTSGLLSARIAIPALRTVVLYRVIGSAPEFKQIIGRGTRLFPGYEKLSFDIIDFVEATRVFSDPRFDGHPARRLRDETDREGRIADTISDPPPYADYVAEPAFSYREEAAGILPSADERYVRAIRARVLGLKMDYRELLDLWAHAESRKRLRAAFDAWPVDTDGLAAWSGCREADVIDLLLYVTWRVPPLTRAERAKRVRQRNGGFFTSYPSPVEQALKNVCDQYAVRGPEALDEGAVTPDVFRTEPGGKPGETEHALGQGEFRDAVDKLGELIYSAR